LWRENGDLRGDPVAGSSMPKVLTRDLIVSFGVPYDVALHPFVGAGTTAKVAMLGGRLWHGFEISADYVAIAHERLRKAERLLLASKATKRAGTARAVPAHISPGRFRDREFCARKSNPDPSKWFSLARTCQAQSPP
jgi:DNA methylase